MLPQMPQGTGSNGYVQTCASCRRGRKNFNSGWMQRRSTVVWEITNSSSASSTTYATQSRVDIGQKGGRQQRGAGKGSWMAVWERIPLRGASRRRVSTRPEAIVTSRGSISRVTDGASGWTWNMAAQPTGRQKQSRHMTMVKWRIAGGARLQGFEHRIEGCN
ncbi:hypothetical protein J3E69DRAFT_327178 [Trichoderma sp. SZMC 28015]